MASWYQANRLLIFGMICGSNNLHNEGGVKFPKGKKPEALIKRIFELFTDPGDLVLDSFLGFRHHRSRCP